jgi:hypothetical protein
MFVNINEYHQENYYEFDEIKPQVLTHLTILTAILRVAFQTQHFLGMNGPDISLQLESLMELACDTSIKIKFEAPQLPDFWIYIRNEYMEPSQLAINYYYFLAQQTCLKKRYQQ